MANSFARVKYLDQKITQREEREGGWVENVLIDESKLIGESINVRNLLSNALACTRGCVVLFSSGRSY